MLDNQPTLSVVVPCWNAIKYLSELLDSIIAQTFQDWILYAVDDQSTDDTLAILKKYSELDSRITYKVRDRGPKGAQTCRNIGFELGINNKFIIFIDSDDILAPYCFEQRVKYMESHPNLDFSVFPAKVFERLVWDDNSFLIGIDDNQDNLSCFLIRVMPFSVWNNIYKVESLLKYRIKWDEKLLSLQDTDLAIQTICKNMQFEFAEDSKIDYFWRVVKGSKSTTTKIKTNEHAISHLYLHEKLYRMIDEEKRNLVRQYIEYYLVVFLENLKNNYDDLGMFWQSSWIKIDKWYMMRMKFYSYLPNNNKIKHLLFPKLVKLYLKTEEVHSIALQMYQNKLLNKKQL